VASARRAQASKRPPDPHFVDADRSRMGRSPLPRPRPRAHASEFETFAGRSSQTLFLGGGRDGPHPCGRLLRLGGSLACIRGGAPWVGHVASALRSRRGARMARAQLSGPAPGVRPLPRPTPWLLQDVLRSRSGNSCKHSAGRPRDRSGSTRATAPYSRYRVTTIGPQRHGGLNQARTRAWNVAGRSRPCALKAVVGR